MGTLAIYPGTFDPVTVGHLDLIRRSSGIFDRIIVAVAVSSGKNPLFTVEERTRMLSQATRGFPKVEVDVFAGLLVEYMRRRQAHVILRGLRAVSDFEYEFQLALMNRKLYSEFEVVYMMPDEKYTYISSSMVKEVAMLGGDISGLVPDEAKAFFKVKLEKGQTHS